MLPGNASKFKVWILIESLKDRRILDWWQKPLIGKRFAFQSSVLYVLILSITKKRVRKRNLSFKKTNEFFLTIHPLLWSNLKNVLEWFFVKGMKVCQALLQRSPCCEDFLKKSDGGLLRGTGYESLFLTLKIWILSYESFNTHVQVRFGIGHFRFDWSGLLACIWIVYP